MNALEIMNAVKASITSQEILKEIEIYERCLKQSLLAGHLNVASRHAASLEHLYKLSKELESKSA